MTAILFDEVDLCEIPAEWLDHCERVKLVKRLRPGGYSERFLMNLPIKTLRRWAEDDRNCKGGN
jgi:hypothetical protein